MSDKIMTDAEWESLSAESRHKTNMMGIEFDRLTADNAKLREALVKYADHESWCVRNANPYENDVFMHGHDGWEIAEKALEVGNEK